MGKCDSIRGIEKTHTTNRKINDIKIYFSVSTNHEKDEEGNEMAKRSSMMSENLKEEIAKELGVYEQVKQDGGWQNVSSKTCGNIVSKAIEIANRSVE